MAANAMAKGCMKLLYISKGVDKAGQFSFNLVPVHSPQSKFCIVSLLQQALDM